MKKLSFRIDGRSVLFSQPFMLDVGQEARVEFESLDKNKYIFTFNLAEAQDEVKDGTVVEVVLSRSKKNPSLYRFKAIIPVPPMAANSNANGQSAEPVFFSAAGLNFGLAFRIMGYKSHWLVFPTVTYKKEKKDNESSAQSDTK